MVRAMSIKKQDVEKFKQILLEERERLRAQSKHIVRRDSASDQSDEYGELSDYDNHPADAATETFEREKDLALDANTRGMLIAVDRALEKVDEETYGICDRCSSDISMGRLEVLPYATFCIECQDKVEGR